LTGVAFFPISSFPHFPKNPKIIGFGCFNYYKENKGDLHDIVWWSLFYEIVDCVLTAAAAIIVVISDRDLKTDFEVRLWIFMLWLYMFYTYVQTLFFEDELVYDQNFMI
jgi:hypothetical protein